MKYDFDSPVDRRNTNSIKYDFAAERGYPEDVLPLWLADMDFRAPEPVLEALRRAVDHGIFGYSDVKEDYFQALHRWFSERFGWDTRPEWLVKTPGVVTALALGVQAFTEPGDAVLVQPPVYTPFYHVVRDNGRRLVESHLVYEDGAYGLDLADFERTVERENVKAFILCSPHNPVGRVWTREELEKLGGICRKHGVFVLSDEIHCDFTYPEAPHTVFLKACPDLAEQTIVCTAPSKTFNLAGQQVSNIWIPGEEARAKFRAAQRRVGLDGVNLLGLVACQAAYEKGSEWLEQCKAYLRKNLDLLRTFLAERLPEVRLVEPQGTYFAWLDFSDLGLDKTALNSLIVERAGLWIDEGSMFGEASWAFQRVVLACTSATLLEALTRLERAVRGG